MGHSPADRVAVGHVKTTTGLSGRGMTLLRKTSGSSPTSRRSGPGRPGSGTAVCKADSKVSPAATRAGRRRRPATAASTVAAVIRAAAAVTAGRGRRLRRARRGAGRRRGRTCKNLSSTPSSSTRYSSRPRRRLLIAGGAVVALAIAVVVYLMSGGPGAANLGFGNFVTNFLPGELQQVPDPCTAVPTATLNQYLPGTRKQAAPPLNSGANTQCTWTLDSPPTYRVLEVQLQAYSPSGLASGNGSATFAAEDAYQSFENGYTKPGPKSGQPKATVTDLSGMPGGNQTSAFQATQVFKRGGAVTDVANVYVRY